MPQFLVEYRDVGTSEERARLREEHIAFRKGLGGAIALAGPILDDDGNANGSLIILEAPDRASAEELASRDPYLTAGVLQLTSVRGYRIAAMKPPAPTPT